MRIIHASATLIGGLSAFVAGTLLYAMHAPGAGLAFIVAGVVICLVGVMGDE